MNGICGSGIGFGNAGLCSIPVVGNWVAFGTKKIVCGKTESLKKEIEKLELQKQTLDVNTSLEMLRSNGQVSSVFIKTKTEIESRKKEIQEEIEKRLPEDLKNRMVLLGIDMVRDGITCIGSIAMAATAPAWFFVAIINGVYFFESRQELLKLKEAEKAPFRQMEKIEDGWETI